MDKQDAQKQEKGKGKRPFLGILSKRSSRVEPQKFDDNEEEQRAGNSPSTSALHLASDQPQTTSTTTNAHQHQQQLETIRNAADPSNTQRQDSNQSDTNSYHLLSTSSTTSSAEPSSSKTNTSSSSQKTFNNFIARDPLSTSKIRPPSNRLSGQFNLCCSIDENLLKSPKKNRYSDPHDVVSTVDPEFNKLHNSHRQQLKLELNAKAAGSGQRNESESVNHGVRTRPLEFRHGEASNSSNAAVVENKFVTKPVVFREYQNHTQRALMSSKSRFKDRFLPPMAKLDGYEKMEQHYSSPNIAEQEEPPGVDRRDSRKSMSFDTVTGSNDGDSGLVNPTSADSLARQALVAAHLLNLIPVDKARQRNYLHGRLGTTSLLGAAELDKILPSREITIFVGTWNMNGQNPPKQMNDFVLPAALEHVPDIIVFGTQESYSERFECE